MTRRKIISDDDVLAAVERVMARLPPARFTLAAAAAEAGIAAATLVQRFGDKRGLVLSAIRRSNTLFARQFVQAEGTPVADLVETMAGWSAGFEDSIAVQVQWLAEDVGDPELAALAAERFALMRAYIQRHLPPLRVPGEAAAQMVEAQWQGVVILWSVDRQGPIAEMVRVRLGALLEALR